MGTHLRRQREKEARRQSILNAAAQAFLEWGISATTMDQVAQRAELSKGSIYLHFQSKEELCLALLVEASRPLNEAIRKARRPDVHPFEELTGLIRAYYDFSLQRPDFFRLVFVLEHQPYRGQVSSALRAEWTAIGKEAMDILADVIARGVARGVLRPCDPWKTAVSLWAAVTGVIVLPAQEVRWDFLGHLDQEELVMATVRNFWSGIQAPNGSLSPADGARRRQRAAPAEERPHAGEAESRPHRRRRGTPVSKRR